MREALLLLALAGCARVETEAVDDPAESLPCDPMAIPEPGDAPLSICCERDAPICVEYHGAEWTSTDCLLYALCGGHCEGWYMPEGQPCGDAGACNDRGTCIE